MLPKVQKLKLQYQPRSSGQAGHADDVVLSSRGTHGLLVGNIFEVYYTEDVCHCTLQVTALKDDIPDNVISLEPSLAQSLELQQNKFIFIKPITKQSVKLDLVEILLRDQYFDRRDAFIFSLNLVSSIVRHNGKIESNEMRGQLCGLWRNGDKVSSGYVESDTTIVLRSATSAALIMIQVSRETWLFDEYGDLYLEKAIKFLTTLVLQFWPGSASSHYTTIVLFTRVHVGENESDEDFYRVFIQNERPSTDEWRRILAELKLEFRKFYQRICSSLRTRCLIRENNDYHSEFCFSSASDGNLLEAVNMGMNFFAGVNIDRNFDRSGKIIFMVTPGAGYFQVSQNLSTITKQRVLNLGIAVDLVCLGQQPLHAVPLFKLSGLLDHSEDEYVVPYWINCSYFRSPQECQRIELGLPISRSQVFPQRRVCSGDRSWQMPSNTGSTVPTNAPGTAETSICGRPSLPIHQIVYPRPMRKVSRLQHYKATFDVPLSQPDTSVANPAKTENPFTSLKQIVPEVCASVSEGGTEDPFADWCKPEPEYFLSTSCSDELPPASGTGRQASSSRGHTTASSITGVSLPLRNPPVQLLFSGTPVAGRGAEQVASHHQHSLEIPGISEHGSSMATGESSSGGPETSSGPSGASSMEGPTSAMDVLPRHSSALPLHPGPVTSQSMKCFPSSLSGDPSTQARTGGKPDDFFSSSAVRLGTSWGLSSRGSQQRRRITAQSAVGQNPRLSVGNRSSAANAALTGLSETGYSRDRGSSISLYPFGAEHEFSVQKSSPGRRRWLLTRPPDRMGLPTAPHYRVSNNHVLDFLRPGKPSTCLTQVWLAYFAYLRHRAGASSQRTSSPLPACLSPLAPDQEVQPVAFLMQHLDVGGGAAQSAAFPLSSSVEAVNQPLHGQSAPDRETRAESTAVGGFEPSASAAAVIVPPETDQAVPDGLLKLLTLIDVDWKSLSTPASLPVETDYFPDEETLQSDEHSVNYHCVMPQGVSPREWRQQYDFTREPGLYYCRRPMTVQEVLHEMVRQRLSHGFQLYSDTKVRSGVSRPADAGPSSEPRTGLSDGPSSSAARLQGGKKLLQPASVPSIQTGVDVGTTSGLCPQTGPTTGARQTVAPTPAGRQSVIGHRDPPAATATLSVKSGRTSRFFGVGRSSGPAGKAERAVKTNIVGSSGAGSLETPTTTGTSSPSGSGFSNRAVYRLSRGCIFHTISLREDTIAVTIHRKHGGQTEPVDYRYTIQVPDSLGFFGKTTTFVSQNALSVNWSYLDNYLCTRGGSDSYRLQPTLQYSRSRFIIIPVFSTETRRLMEAMKESSAATNARIHCDVFHPDYLAMDPMQLCENFVQFMRTATRIRRLPSALSGRRQATRQSPMIEKMEAGSQVYPREASLAVGQPEPGRPLKAKPLGSPATTTLETSGTGGGLLACSAAASFQRLLNQFKQPIVTTFTESMLCPTEAPVTTTTTIGADNVLPSPVLTSFSEIGVEAEACQVNPEPAPILNSAPAPTPLCVAAALMREPQTGFSFVMPSDANVFPEFTFISFDAVAWAQKWLPDVQTVRCAVNYFQRLLEAGWIRHTSGNPQHRFIHGFHLYTLLCPEPRHWNTRAGGASFEWAGSGVTSAAPSGTVGPSGSGGAASGKAGEPVMVQQSGAIGLEPLTFPEAYLPRATQKAGADGFTLEFQREWGEVAFAWQVFERAGAVGSVGETSVAEKCSELLNSASFRSTCGLNTSRGGYYESEISFCKSIILDLTDNRDGDGRVEWVHMVYDANYHPLCGFSIELQWLVASGGRLTDLVNKWLSCARLTGFHFVSVPCHPFGQQGPRADTDPCRSPIWLPIAPLNRLTSKSDVETTESSTPDFTIGGPSQGLLKACPADRDDSVEQTGCSVAETVDKLFPDFPSNQRILRLRFFQDYVLKRFGFIRENCDSLHAVVEAQDLARLWPSQELIDKLSQHGWRYVHCSGGMFVLIPTYSTGDHHHDQTEGTQIPPRSFAGLPGKSVETTPTSATATSTAQTSEVTHHKQSFPSERENIHKSPTQKTNTDCFVDQLEIGFFWSWNHMLPKRWRCNVTGDEAFQDGVLADFRDFISAQDGRLAETFSNFLKDFPCPSNVCNADITQEL